MKTLFYLFYCVINNNNNLLKIVTLNNLSLVWLMVFNTTFKNISGGGRSWSTRREPPTMGKQLVNFITCESSTLFCNIQSRAREPTPSW
jgi:hypothetical protein